MNLDWIKCTDGWCPFYNVDLSHSHFDSMEGVYIIWGANKQVIRVGQGVVKDRISCHQGDSRVCQYNPLYVTWAAVHSHYRDGVERYLAEVLRPLVGDAFPRAIPIKVNLPA